MFHQPVFALEIAVRDIAGEQGCHEFHFKVSLQVGRLVGDQSVRCGVTLVKAVACELQNHVPEVFRFLLGQALFHAARQEFFCISRDQRFLLLADRLDARVGFGQLDPTQSV